MTNPAAEKIPIYTPKQIFAGSVLGGPVALVYFLRSNFQRLGNASAAKQTLIWGTLFNLAVIVMLPFLPERFPKFIFPLAYSWAARAIADSRQLNNEAIAASDRYRFRSNWAVVGWSIALVVGTLVVWFGILLLLDHFHVINLG